MKRISLPVIVDVCGDRFHPGIEATAYFVVSEALTNSVKHSGARRAEVKADADNGALRVEIRDDGAGGAEIEAGTGLEGLQDRVIALDGRLQIESPPGGGTRIVATLPATTTSGFPEPRPRVFRSQVSGCAVWRPERCEAECGAWIPPIINVPVGSPPTSSTPPSRVSPASG